MELYGTKLHVLLSITGGFILRRNDKWPNIIKCVVLLVLIFGFFVVIEVDMKIYSTIIVSTLIALFVLVIELIVIWFNSLLDDSVNASSSSTSDDSLNWSIPPGISAALWENRMILFNESYSMDERAYQLVRKGFDIDEVIHLVSLTQNGTVTRETKDRAPIRRIKTNLIVLCGQVINVHFDRESLNRTFARPVNNWHIIISSLLTLLLGVCASTTRTLNTLGINIYLAIICATATFSLLQPPPCDPYSTSFDDPFISYTRSAIASVFSGAAGLLVFIIPKLPTSTYLSTLGITMYWTTIAIVLRDIASYAFRCYPLLIIIGIVGHPITTMHWLFESLNKYLFGISGSIGLKKTVSSFLTSLFIALIVVSILYIGYNAVTVGISIFVVTFFTQFSIADNCGSFMKKNLLASIVTAIIAGFTSLFNWLINPSAMAFILYSIVICHFVIDVAFPYLATYENYVIFNARLVHVSYLTKVSHYLTNFVTAPAFISIALIKYPINPFLAAIIVIHALRLAQTLPHAFCFSLLLTMCLFKIDFGIDNLSVSLLSSLLIVRKLIKVIRLSRMWVKMRPILSVLYADPLSNPFEYFKAAILAVLLSSIPQPTGAISTPSFLWSLITGSPMSIFFGYKMIYGFSPPRPNSFYDYSPDTSSNSTFDHPLEAPVYASLSEILVENLGRMVKDGELGLVNDDSFYLMVAGDLVAILHIIAIEANKVSFQVRGLEYVAQTLCHGGELSVIQQIIQETDSTSGNFGHAIAFSHSVFELRARNRPLEMTGVSQYSLVESVISVLGSSFLSWELKALVYFGLKGIGRVVISEDSEEMKAVKPQFSERNVQFVRYVAEKLEIELNEKVVRRLWLLTHFVHSVLIGEKGRLKVDQICSTFDGKIELPQLLKDEESAVFNSFRYSMASMLMASVGLAPTNDSADEIFEFFEETEKSCACLPITSPEIEEILKEGQRSVITMIPNGDVVNIVRFAKATTSWSFFKLDSEAVRGFWANETRSILYFANHSKERTSIQFDIQTLRNITNQSCNLPVGYPAYVSGILSSLSEQK